MKDQKITTLGDRFQKALIFANQLHQEQTRKMSGTPYISHPMAVAALVLQDGGSEDEAIAALLHDTAEDQGGKKTLLRIEDQFGKQIAEIVAQCSDTFEYPKPPWRERKEAHLKNLQFASQSTHRVILADKLHNARSLLRDMRVEGNEVWKHFNGGKEGTLWYFEEIYDLLKQKHEGYLIHELERVIRQIKLLAQEK